MKKWFPLVMVLALAAIGTPLEAGIFDRLVNDTAETSNPLASAGGEIVHSSPEIHAPAPVMDHAYTDHGPAQTGFGYPFKTDCCESQNACVGELWRGYCSRAHGACQRMQARFANAAHRSSCGGGCGKGGCATGNCGKGGGGKGGITFGKGFGHVQHGHVQHGHVQHGHVQHGHVQQKSQIQRSHIQRSHVQRSFVPRSHVQFGHVQHGKGFAGCHACGQTPCGCHAKGHHQRSFGFGWSGKSCAGGGCGKGGCATGNCGKGGGHLYGKGAPLQFRLGLFDRRHRCETCGKSAGLGFGKGGCDCGGATIGKGMGKGGWSQDGGVIWEQGIWDKGHSFDAPQHGQPTPANDPPVDLEIPIPPTTDALPVPPTPASPTAQSASIRRLPPVTGYQY